MAKKRAILRGVLGISVALTVVYLGDYCTLRHQIPHGRPQFGQITVDVLYAIHQKNGKIEYQTADPQIDRCVHSLLPHFGSNPCWSASRHTERFIEI